MLNSVLNRRSPELSSASFATIVAKASFKYQHFGKIQNSELILASTGIFALSCWNNFFYGMQHLLDTHIKLAAPRAIYKTIIVQLGEIWSPFALHKGMQIWVFFGTSK